MRGCNLLQRGSRKITIGRVDSASWRVIFTIKDTEFYINEVDAYALGSSGHAEEFV